MSLTLSPWKFQFDDSGKDPKNLISSEAQTFSGPDHLAFPLNEGMFYGDSIKVRRRGSNDLLVNGEDYNLEGFDGWMTAETGQDVFTTVNLKDKTYTGTLEITYQCLGGAQGMPIGFMLEVLEALKKATDNPQVDFITGVINKPTYYPGHIHKHPWSSMEQTDLINQALREVTNAIINRIPMADSGNHYQEQIDRLMSLCGKLRNSINSIVTVQGSSSKIQELLDQINKLETITTSNVVIGTGESALIGEWSLEEHNAVRGVLNILAGGQVESLDFMCQGIAGDTPSVTTFANLRSATKILELSVVRVGNKMRLTATSAIAGRVKAKVYAVL